MLKGFALQILGLWLFIVACLLIPETSKVSGMGHILVLLVLFLVPVAIILCGLWIVGGALKTAKDKPKCKAVIKKGQTNT
jgi:Na+/phosphate symporter